MTPAMRDALQAVGRRVTFASGDILRHKGAFAPDMLLIVQGEVDCALSDAGDVHLTVGPDTIVGEIGFLTGKGANATLRALTPVEALSLDSSALQRLQRETPAIAADILRLLARLIQDRTEQNEDLLADIDPRDDGGFEIVRCSTLDQLRIAQRVRYDVYCLEFGRSSPYADADEGTIVDELDGNGTSFVAYHDGLAVGTVRVNLGRDGDFGILSDLYGIPGTPFSIEDSSIITKYAIREAYRGGSAYIRLFAAIGTFVHASGATAIFIDCNPELARFYATMGFTRTADNFVHYENGLSVPMVLDLVDYLDRMSFAERYRKNRWR